MTAPKEMFDLTKGQNGKRIHLANEAGQVDLEAVIPGRTEEAIQKRNEIAELDAEFRQRMSPRGELNLPPLLDQRRLEWGIIDSAFARQAAFDRVYIWQIPEQRTETFGEGSLIVMTDQSKARLKNEAPRGILLSAGLKALDSLRSNGMDLGHIVNFIQAAPWRIFIDYIKGHRPAILVMNAGDILGSEDTARALREKEFGVTRRENQHVYADREGKYEVPIQPWIGDDM